MTLWSLLHCFTIQLAKSYEKILSDLLSRQTVYNIIFIYVAKTLSKSLEKRVRVRLNNTPHLSSTWGWRAESTVYKSDKIIPAL